MTFDVKGFDVAEYDRILDAGLSKGMGQRGQQVCIEAAICQVLGLSHSDDPGCVAASVRSFKIELNDGPWPSPDARAKGLHDLGLAQLGSLGVVNDVEFSKRMAEKTIRTLLPKLFREVFPGNKACLAAADRCEQEGTQQAAWSARSAAKSAESAAWSARSAAKSAKSAESAAWSARSAAWSAKSAESAAWSARSAAKSAESAAWSARSAAKSAESAAWSACSATPYLNLSAQLALETLRELRSPGVALLEPTMPPEQS